MAGIAMTEWQAAVKSVETRDCTAGVVPGDVYESQQPVLLKGLVKHWPLVQAGLQSDQTAADYLRQFYTGKPVVTYSATAEHQGRYFYHENLASLNYSSRRAPLDEILSLVLQTQDNSNSDTHYVGSSDVNVYLPGFSAHNTIAVPNSNPLVAIWLGNKSRIACHYDVSDNLACVAVGKRRFTLFPPEQIHNLYPGPIDFTPAGQTVSLVDFSQPDLTQFPRFSAAIAQAQVADMEAGDALFMPTMWWHHVEGLCDFNVLINYWWRNVPAYRGHGVDALKHAMLSIRELPDSERLAWKHVFDYYVFNEQTLAREHIPSPAQGSLAPITETLARQLRAWVINKLNR
jgi:Cupin-like domain